MFCPSCGLEEHHNNQFCRACGADLRNVRFALEKPDSITASAVTAREEIGRSVAAQIRQIQSGRDLTLVAEDVLPQIEKFLESPAEKRLRRLRTGTIISSVGCGAAVASVIIGLFIQNIYLYLFAGLGIITFFVGLGFMLNAVLFTNPQKTLPDKSDDAVSQRELDNKSDELILPKSNQEFSSITENTTRNLINK